MLKRAHGSAGAESVQAFKRKALLNTKGSDSQPFHEYIFSLPPCFMSTFSYLHHVWKIKHTIYELHCTLHVYCTVLDRKSSFNQTTIKFSNVYCINNAFLSFSPSFPNHLNMPLAPASGLILLTPPTLPSTATCVAWLTRS